MLSYQNVIPPENINVTKSNPLLGMLEMLLGLVVLIALMTGILYIAGAAFARHMPFSWDIWLSDKLIGKRDQSDNPQASAYLQKLADNMVKGIDLPKDMRFVVHYVNDDTVNAFATLGGNIFLHKGLIDKLHSENAVAMVLAHEMAHVINRDPADAVGGRLALMLTFGVGGMLVGDQVVQEITNVSSGLTLLTFTRDAESRADDSGMRLVARHYGHLGGAQDLFKELAAYEAKVGIDAPELLSSHPDTLRRIASVPREAEMLKVSLTGKLTPLPPLLRSGHK